MVDVAARYGPYRAKCLVRSLVLLRLMAQNGWRGELILGANLNSEEFGAHAWVQYQGEVVNDRVDVERDYGKFVGSTGKPE